MKLNHPFHFDFSNAVILKEKLCEVAIGNVTTVESQNDAAIATRSVGNRVLFDFALPKGETGYSTTATITTMTAPVEEASWSPSAQGQSITITDKDGQKTFTTMPIGMYAHPMVCQTITGKNISLKANICYSHIAMENLNGNLTITLLSQNRYHGLLPLFSFLDTWKIIINTSTKGKTDYISALHLPQTIRVPSDWVGQQSSLSSDYMEYYLKENTRYMLTFETTGSNMPFYLSCQSWSNG